MGVIEDYIAIKVYGLPKSCWDQLIQNILIYFKIKQRNKGTKEVIFVKKKQEMEI